MDKCFITSYLNDMERFAKEANVPIMLSESIDYICDLIRDKKYTSVLEIGTAIGYSAIKMCEAGATITSIERDEERYSLAVKNVNSVNMMSKITLIFSDAFDTDITDTFDMILIDAAKGKNIEFIEKFKRNLNKGGIIIIDNVDFHGYVGHSSEIKSRNLRALVRKIERFWEYLDSQQEYEVTKVEKGDGLIILKEGTHE